MAGRVEKSLLLGMLRLVAVTSYQRFATPRRRVDPGAQSVRSRLGSPSVASVTTVQRLAAAGLPADFPAALARAAAGQQQPQQPLQVPSAPLTGLRVPSPMLASPPTEQGSGASPFAAAMLDAGLASTGQAGSNGMSNALRFATQYPPPQYPGLLSQMSAPPRPASAPLPPSMVAGRCAADATAPHPLARANLSGQLDTQHLLAAQAQLGAGAGSPFQVWKRPLQSVWALTWCRAYLLSVKRDESSLPGPYMVASWRPCSLGDTLHRCYGPI